MAITITEKHVPVYKWTCPHCKSKGTCEDDDLEIIKIYNDLDKEELLGITCPVCKTKIKIKDV